MGKKDSRIARVDVEKHEGTGFFGGDSYTAKVTLQDGRTAIYTSSQEDSAIQNATEMTKYK